MTDRPTGLRIAAIVPCHNEEITIGKVVRDLSAAVPEMTVYVYDNNSTDRTVEEALARQRRFDPDLWVIAVEDRGGRTLLDEPGLAD